MIEILVAVALAGTLVVLLAGVVVMLRGGELNRRYGNKLMRARVAMQLLAVALLFILFLLKQG